MPIFHWIACQLVRPNGLRIFLCLLLLLGFCSPLLLASPACNNTLPSYRLYDSYNRDGVSNNPLIYPTFATNVPLCIEWVQTYHWNYGSGQDPTAVNGWLGIYDLSSNTFVIQEAASALPPPFGVLNTNWIIYPYTMLPPGTYRIVDSDPSTWSYSTTDYFHRPGDGPDWQPYLGFAKVYAATPEPANLSLMGTGLALFCMRAASLLRRKISR